MDLTGDDHLERAVTELGDPDSLFRISRGRFLAKLSLGVLLLVIGAVANYLWWVEGPGNPDHFIFLILLGLPISGLSLLLHMYRNRGLYVLIYPTGLLRLRHGEVDSFPWGEIEHVRLRLQRAEAAEFTRDADGTPLACWVPADVPTFKLGDAGLTLIRTDGTEAHLSPALTDYKDLAEQVQKRTFSVLWASLRARFREGDSVSFGELEADLSGLRHAGKLLRWRELKELTIAQGKFSVKQIGKWLPWALVDVGSVSNPHLLFALVEEARRFHASPISQPKEQPAEQLEQQEADEY